MSYVFHPEALNEYADAVQYYSEQRIEVAQAFINAIVDTVIGLESLQPVTLKLMKMFGDVWPVSFLMAFSTQLSKITS